MSFGIGMGLGLSAAGARAPSAYVPGTITSMRLALEAGRGGYVTDQSGKGNNFVAVSSPTVTPGAGPNGKSVITLDGVAQCFTRSGSIGTFNGATIIHVAKFPTSPGVYAPVLAWASAGASDFSDPSGAIAWDGGSTGAQGFDVWWGGVHILGDQALSFNAYHCVRIDIDSSGNFSAFADGVQIGTTQAGAATAPAPAFFSFGSRVLTGAAAATFAPVSLCASYITNAILAGADKTAMASYISTTFGLTL